MPIMSRRRWLFLSVSVLLALGGAFLWLRPEGWDQADKMSSVGGFLTGLLGIVISLRPQRDTQGGSPDTSELANTLADVVQDQWEREVTNQGLHRLESLPVRWAITTRGGLRDHPEAVFGAGATAQDESSFSGTVTDVAQQYLSLPRRRLVVLGESGSGKSVLAARLLLDLLDERQGTGPVPVLLPVRSWDPAQEHLDDWIVRELASLYYGRQEAVPRQLMREHALIPILDGLDEIARASQHQVLPAIDRATGGRWPVIVTSRVASYQEMAEVSSVLVGAAVIEIAPLDADSVVASLNRSAPVGDHRWAPVIHHLRAHPRGYLAEALSTPLMVFLAQTAYGSRQGPVTLIDSVRQLGSRQEVERALVRSLVPARYQSHPDPHHARPRAAYTAEEAEHWLGYLARHLQHSGTRDLAWWKLAHSVPRAVLGTFFLVGGGLLLGYAAASLFGTSVGIAVGVIGGTFFGFGGELVEAVFRLFGQHIDRSSPVPVHAVLRQGGRVRLLAGTLVAGSVGGMGFATALLAWRDLGAAWGSVAVVFAMTACLVMVTGLADVLRGPVHLTELTPRSILSSDRTTAALRAIGLSAGVAIGILALTRTEAGLGSAIGFGLVSALSGYGDSAWGFFILTRCWLALTGRLPLRLMAFLEDAYHRGILRQYGPVYQFRHQHLQESLAAP
ncbi:NACHT domain-containing protein [Streptomyces sp. ICN988]|uniref:NACHT domain-containing protein n=1 Tax=Streptomyces sp. ICN988 TaxID=2983765 RepID=UPI0021E48D05|nr:NACHT domain-containing protein [Streptomyces sp. ICN988]MCV2457753.1 NACHT domain-containing protein [Streptomyces sp. ICN988]